MTSWSSVRIAYSIDVPNTEIVSGVRALGLISPMLHVVSHWRSLPSAVSSSRASSSPPMLASCSSSAVWCGMAKCAHSLSSLANAALTVVIGRACRRNSSPASSNAHSTSRGEPPKNHSLATAAAATRLASNSVMLVALDCSRSRLSISTVRASSWYRAHWCLLVAHEISRTSKSHTHVGRSVGLAPLLLLLLVAVVLLAVVRLTLRKRLTSEK